MTFKVKAGLKVNSTDVVNSAGYWIGSTITVAKGGTGATDAGGARTNLGLGSIATQASDNVNITGGSITGVTISVDGSGLSNLNASNVTSGTLDSARLDDSGVVAETYGSASIVPVVVVDAKGRVTSATNTNIAISSSAVSGLATSATTDTTNADNISSGTLNADRLATSGVSSGTYGAADSVSTIVVDSKGRVTSATNTSIAITSGQVSGLATSATTDTTNATNITSGTLANARLPDSGVVAETYGSASIVPVVVVDAKGIVTSVTNTNIAITSGAVSGLATSATTDTTNASNITSGTLPDGRFPATLPAISGQNLTSLNADNISSGTISNDRTTAATANGASTIVLRDAAGGFSAGDVTVQNAVVSGNLTVQGTTTTVNSVTIELADNILLLNSNASDATVDAGIEVGRGSSANVFILWDEDTDRWQITNDGSNYYNIPIPTEYNNYEYDLTAVSGGKIRLSGDGSNSDVTLVGAGTVSVAQTDAGTLTITGTGALSSETTGVTTGSAVAVDVFAAATYRSAEYHYTVTTTTGDNAYGTGKVLLVHDGTNTFTTTFAILSTDGVGDDLVTFTSQINGSNVELLAQGTNETVTVQLNKSYTEVL